jgi:hypothetical protein
MVTILVKKGQSTLNSFHLRRSKTCKGQEIMKVSRIEPGSNSHGGQ